MNTRFTITHDNLTASIKLLALAAGTYATEGIRANANPGWISLSTFNYDAGVIVELPASNTVSGEVALPLSTLSKSLAASIKGVPRAQASKATVTIAGGDNTADVEMGGYTLPMRADAPLAEMPDMPELPPLTHRLPLADLRDMVERATPAVSTDNAAPILTGFNVKLCPGRVQIEATDRYRLVVDEATATGNTEGSCVAPGKLLARFLALVKGDEVALGLNKDWLVVRVDETVTFLVRTLLGPYPEVRRFLELVTTTAVTVPAEQLAKAAARASALTLAMGKNKNKNLATEVAVTLSTEGVTVAPVTDDRVPASAPVTAALNADGESLVVRVNGKYLSDALGTVGEDNVTLATAERKPLVITSSKVGWTHLMMTISAPA